MTDHETDFYTWTQEQAAALRKAAAGRYASVREAVGDTYVDVDRIDKDHDLDSLRQRADFQKLLVELRVQEPVKSP